MKKVTNLVIIFLITSCAYWSKTEIQNNIKELKISFKIEGNWMKHYDKKSTTLELTSHGPELENILIRKYSENNALPFSKKKFKSSFSTIEISELVINEIGLSPNFSKYELINNTPEKVADKEYFVLDFKITTHTGLIKIKKIYGTIYNKSLYIFDYSGAERYYYNLNLKKFTDMINTVKYL